MDIRSVTHQQQDLERFSYLRNQAEQTTLQKTHQRLSLNPYPTSQESIVGAFVEMYEPHILPVMSSLFKKGYIIERTSGFCGTCFNCQTLNGLFPLDYIVVNKLAKIGAKIQTEFQTKSIRFWPKTASLSEIKEKYKQIVNILPQRSEPPEPSQSQEAKKFRRTYMPQDAKLKQQRLFEILKFNILKKMSGDIKKRLLLNPDPDKTELRLGTFLEMIEPQVREAIIILNSKGYTTDVSGFMGKADSQIIDGDFIVEESVVNLLKDEGVNLETNHSGYTRIQFWPAVADLKTIRNKWKKIVSIFPDKGKLSDAPMTQKAREFRIKYSA